MILTKIFGNFIKKSWFLAKKSPFLTKIGNFWQFLPQKWDFYAKNDIFWSNNMKNRLFMCSIHTKSTYLIIFGLIIDYLTEIQNFMILKHDFGTIQEHEYHPIFDKNDNFGCRL